MQESIAEKLIGKIQDRMNTLRIGPPLDKAIRHWRPSLPAYSSNASSGWSIKYRGRRDFWQPFYTLADAWSVFPPTLLSTSSPLQSWHSRRFFGPCSQP